MKLQLLNGSVSALNIEINKIMCEKGCIPSKYQAIVSSNSGLHILGTANNSYLTK